MSKPTEQINPPRPQPPAPSQTPAPATGPRAEDAKKALGGAK